LSFSAVETKRIGRPLSVLMRASSAKRFSAASERSAPSQGASGA
jgi:hypothetical protein